jgi:PTS system cellobiose-specific IIB component
MNKALFIQRKKAIFFENVSLYNCVFPLYAWLVQEMEEKKMKKILLVCNAGMSTSVLVQKMEEEAEKNNIKSEIKAISETELEDEWKNFDIILMGPQIKFLQKHIKQVVNDEIPVKVIDQLTYGRMDGKAVLKMALEK